MAQLACSVIIVSYYTNGSLFECLAALFAQQTDDLTIEVIVVDNGNPASDSKRLATLAAAQRIRWLKGQGNIGFAAGCNLGVRHASTDTVLLLNPDCVAEANTMRHLLTFLQTQPEKTLVSGWVTNPDGSEQRGLRRNLLTPWSLFIEMLPLVKHLPPLARRRLNLTGQPLPPVATIRVPACSGACMLLPKALYEQLGGMDEGYFLHVDDLDFCLRLQQQGGQICIQRNSVFAHYQGTSVVSGKRVARHKRNSFNRYFAKHFPRFWRSPPGWGLRLAIAINYWLSKSS
ncbi:MAG: glycosyltransferase [Gammaproteobacteria bacterium]|nr:MAG: glycosyltransferase [Gammaproteobacteria bacterium]